LKKYVLAILLLCGVVFSWGIYTSLHKSGESQAASSVAGELISGAPQDVPVAGTVTMVDLGAHKCVPCKMMAPIIKELSTEYDGRAAIVFIDVWENADIPQQFGIRTIPTQIFYDDKGVEQFRHEGFLDKESIVAALKKLGVQ